MMGEYRNGIKTRSGFTLMETLIVMLILLMVSSVVATGLPVAVNVLDTVVETSNAQLLLSTTMTALRDELSMARDIKIVDATTIVYTNSSGLKSKIYLAENITGKTDGIYLTQYTDISSSEDNAKTELLVSKEASNKGRKDDKPVLHVTYSEVKFDSNTNVVTFTGLAVMRNGKEAATTGTTSNNYSIRVVCYTSNP